jgi:hypothetical protein
MSFVFRLFLFVFIATDTSCIINSYLLCVGGVRRVEIILAPLGSAPVVSLSLGPGGPRGPAKPRAGPRVPFFVV